MATSCILDDLLIFLEESQDCAKDLTWWLNIYGTLEYGTEAIKNYENVIIH